MTDTMKKIENLVALIQVRKSDPSNPSIVEFAQHDDVVLAKALAQLAVTHLDDVMSS